MRALNIAAVSCFVLAAACTPPAPPAPPAPHSAMDVNASFGRTWDALIDHFSANNIPIKTIDRTSGLIATDPLAVDRSFADYADCGKGVFGESSIYYPTQATYTALVRGDSTHSTVRISVRWTRVGAGRGLSTDQVTEECSSRGTWETAAEQQIKAAAEAKR